MTSRPCRGLAAGGTGRVVGSWLVLVLVLVGPLASWGAEPAEDEVRQALAKAGTAADWGGAGAVVVWDRRDVTVEESGLARTEHRTLVKVLSASGARQLSVTLLPYDPLSADVTVVRCRVYRADGSLRDVSPEQVQDNPDPQSLIFWNSREKLVPVGRLQVGDGVELVTRRVGFTYALLAGGEDESRFIPPMRGHFYDIVPFWSEWPVVEQSYRVRIDPAKHLQYQFFHGAAEVSDRLEGGSRVVTVTMRGFRPLEPEKGMVALSDVAPKLLLTTAADWQAKAIWFHDVQERYGSFTVTPEIKAVADHITAGLATDEEKAAALTHWVAENIRYVGLHMGEGEGYTLHRASTTLRDRGGVCKDKAGMLVALLRAAGLEAYAGMTMAGERIEDIPADQFNHCITVWRKADRSTVLLDPTWVPGVRELWSSREQQQQVLKGLPEGADLATTPVSPPEAHPLHVRIVSRLAADGTLEGTLSVTADGQSDAALRRLYRRALRSSWGAVDDAFLTALEVGAEVTTIQRSDPDDLSVPFRFEAAFRIPGYARRLTDGSLVLVPLVARHPVGVALHAEELSLDLAKEERRHPVRIGCSKLVRLSEQLTLPPGTTVRGVPEGVSLAGSGALEARCWVEGGVLVVEETLSLAQRVFSPAEWPSLRGALKAFRELAEHPITVEPGRGKRGGAQ